MGATTPVVTQMRVVPVAGYDSMLMTLSGAHAPYFIRNLVILTAVNTPGQSLNGTSLW